MPGDDTICEDFFEVIDTPLKAYIIGLIVFNKTDSDDNVIVEIKLNNVKEHDNNNKCISYGYYMDLKDDERKHYQYFNNIDILIKHLRKIGNVKYTEQSCINGIIELTITSQNIKDDIGKHININNCKDADISEFITKCYNEDANKCNQFVRAYIEKYASIIYDNINITFYNENTANSIIKLYDIPCIRQKNINNLVIQFNSVNMIDLLGMIYSNYDCPYYNNYIYTYNNRDGKSIPCIKVFKACEEAVIPSKARYSDAGYDLTIIKEHKRLNSKTVIYDTGIKLEIPNGYYVEIVPRSSISRSGYMLANNVGIIDQGYRGNLYIALTKINDEIPDITDLANWRLPWKCCQMIVKKQIYSKLVYCDSGQDDIEKSNRGTGAFGSTD
jgi:deoxyuridine 5'-triphosphate nucleotidohydrolase